MSAFWAIHKGGAVGVYHSWPECKAALHVQPALKHVGLSLDQTWQERQAETIAAAATRPVFGKFTNRETAELFVATGQRTPLNGRVGSQVTNNDNNPRITLTIDVDVVETAAVAVPAPAAALAPAAAPTLSFPSAVSAETSSEEKGNADTGGDGGGDEQITSFNWKVSYTALNDDGSMKEEGNGVFLFGGVCDHPVRAWLTAATRATAWAALNRKTRLVLHHGSNYLHGCIFRQWMTNWAKRHWKTASHTTIKHYDLVSKLYQLSLRVELLSFCHFASPSNSDNASASSSSSHILAAHDSLEQEEAETTGDLTSL